MRWVLPRRTLLGMAAVWPLVGCDRQAALRPEHEIRMGVSGRPRSLDPRFATDALSSRLNRLIYQALVDFDDHFQPIPQLAQWQSLAPDHYRFTLQGSPRFQDGQPLTAQDVKATFDSILDPETGSPHRGSLKHIRAVKVRDARTVDFMLEKSDPLLPGRLNIGILPVRALAAGQDFNRQPLGSGPCQLVRADEQRTVLRRPDGWRLAFIKVKDPLVQVLKLRKGELDLIQGGLSPELTAYCARRPELAVQWHRGTNFAYLGFNFQDPVLADVRVRRAIAHGIDRAAIVRAFFRGHARLAGGLLVPEHWAGLKNWQGFAYDPDRARALLHEAIGDRRLPLSYKTSANPLRLRLAAVYQDQLRRIGIDLSIQSYDWGTFYADIKRGRFQLYSLAWVGIKSPDIFQYVFHSRSVPPNGANRGRYRDAEVDRLIEAALAAPTVAEQARYYQRLQQRLAETVAMVPLWYEDQFAVQRRALQGYRLYADGRYDGLLQATRQEQADG